VRSLKRFLERFRNFAMRRRNDDRLREEIDHHVALQTAENLRAGLPPAEAHRQAKLKFGGVEGIKEEYRAERSLHFLETLLQDVRYALRTTRKSPGFATVAVLTLALGIGANTAIFSLTDQALLSLLPVSHPEQLVILSSTEMKWGHTEDDYDLQNSFSYLMYKNLRDENSVFSGLLACFAVDVSVAPRGHADLARGELVSGNFFNVLGVRPALGRVFSSADESAPGANPVVVLNHAYWNDRFAASASVLNHTLDINGYPFIIVGVAQPGFDGVQAGQKPDLYIPITMKAELTPGWNGLDSASDYFLPIVGRLKPGISLASAQASLQPLFHSLLEAEYPGLVARWGASEDRQRFVEGKIRLSPGEHGRGVLQHSVKAPLLFLSAMVGLVLLIACANIVCLSLARGESRQHEIAIRLALGGGHGRIVRQLLTESTLLALAGGAGGLLAGWLLLRALISAMPPDPAISGIAATLDARVLAFTAAAAIVSGLLCGLFPAARAARIGLQSAFKDKAGGTTGTTGSVRLRKSLLVAQTAIAALLLIAVGLFGESLINTERVNLGMRISHIVQFDFTPGLSRYSPAKTLGLFARLQATLSALPGVSSVSASGQPILAGGMGIDTVNYEGYRPSAGDENEGLNPWVNDVEPDFFSTLGIPLLEGRDFRRSDSLSNPEVAIISESITRKFFAGRNPIGLHFGFGGETPHIEIVGVVGDTRQNDPRWPPSASIYLPTEQDQTPTAATFYVRTSLTPSAIIPALRGTVAQLAPDVAVANLRTLTDQFNDTIFDERMIAFLTMAFGLLAILLASIGLYGVMAYVVARRTREIGIRVALGASRNTLGRMILWQAGEVTLIGLAIGLSAAVPMSRLIRSQLFDVKPEDPLVFLFSALLLAVVALAACWIPARRAMRVDPMVALRHE
jgi:putative ABC transport system permease protein